MNTGTHSGVKERGKNWRGNDISITPEENFTSLRSRGDEERKWIPLASVHVPSSPYKLFLLFPLNRFTASFPFFTFLITALLVLSFSFPHASSPCFILLFLFLYPYCLSFSFLFFPFTSSPLSVCFLLLSFSHITAVCRFLPLPLIPPPVCHFVSSSLPFYY